MTEKEAMRFAYDTIKTDYRDVNIGIGVNSGAIMFIDPFLEEVVATVEYERHYGHRTPEWTAHGSAYTANAAMLRGIADYLDRMTALNLVID